MFKFIFIYFQMEFIFKNRKKCVICRNKNLKEVFSKINYPITFSPPISPDVNNDYFLNQTFLECQNCYCIQIKELINQNILYEQYHNLNINTPTWIKHHKLFSDFVFENVKNINNNKLNSTEIINRSGNVNNNNKLNITEIGGCSKNILNQIKNYVKNYFSLDLYSPNEKIEGVKYCLGNCENFDFSDCDIIIMSHVFEHLFNSVQFVQSIFEKGVKNVIISIPNMEALLKSESMSVLHNEHTYYLNDTYVNFIFFTKAKYKLTNRYEFLNHSIFYFFQIIDEANEEGRKEKNEVKEAGEVNKANKAEDITIAQFKFDKFLKIISIYTNKIKIIEDLFFNKQNENLCIVPGGHFGQLLYYYLSPEIRNKVHFFLDNDPTKQNKRVYGTPVLVKSFDYLKNNIINFSIILYGGPYNEELIKQLKTYNIEEKNIYII